MITHDLIYMLDELLRPCLDYFGGKTTRQTHCVSKLHFLSAFRLGYISTIVNNKILQPCGHLESGVDPGSEVENTRLTGLTGLTRVERTSASFLAPLHVPLFPTKFSLCSRVP